MIVATNRQSDHTFDLISLLMSNTLSSCSCILHCNPIIMFYLGSRVGTEVAKKINLEPESESMAKPGLLHTKSMLKAGT
jgi:hypothetical protein